MAYLANAAWNGLTIQLLKYEELLPAAGTKIKRVSTVAMHNPRPLWVINCRATWYWPCPLYPRERTSKLVPRNPFIGTNSNSRRHQRKSE
jgi:hypothetical protein